VIALATPKRYVPDNKSHGYSEPHNDDLVFAVTRLYVDTVEFIRFIQLIAFTLQNLDDTDGLTQQNGEKTLQHAEIGLVTQQAFHSPIKTIYLSFCSIIYE